MIDTYAAEHRMIKVAQKAISRGNAVCIKLTHTHIGEEIDCLRLDDGFVSFNVLGTDSTVYTTIDRVLAVVVSSDK